MWEATKQAPSIGGQQGGRWFVVGSGVRQADHADLGASPAQLVSESPKESL